MVTMTNHIVTMGGNEQGKNRHNISFGIHRDYTTEAHRLFASVPQFKSHLIDNDYIKQSKYYAIANSVLDQPSMGWAFKAISIMDVLESIEEQDFLLWCDSNHIIVGDLSPMISYTYEKGIFCHDHTPTYYPNRDWTLRDTFIHMGCDEERYWIAPQIQVNVMAFVKNQWTMQFIKEWLKYCLDYKTIIGNNEFPNFPGFKEHRHEQSIFSILREKYELPYTLGEPYTMIREEMGIDKNEG
jgi:hypothetical protein